MSAALLVLVCVVVLVCVIKVVCRCVWGMAKESEQHLGPAHDTAQDYVFSTKCQFLVYGSAPSGVGRD